MLVTDLRCNGPRLHGVVDWDSKTIEVKCGRRECGHESGVVVLHTFCLQFGRLLSTKTFSDPVKKGTPHDTR